MRLIIVRHGQTIENEQGIVQGQTPGHLSELGISQAGKIGERLKKEKIDYIYTSDLKRAVDTTKQISKHHNSTSVKLIKALREGYWGKLQGKKRKEIDLKLYWDKDSGLMRPKDGESPRELTKRVQDFLYDTIKEHPNKTILMVSHGGTIRSILSVIMSIPLRFMQGDIGHIENTSLTILDIDKNLNYRTLFLNDTKHLKK